VSAKVFHANGLRDSVSISFFALSLFDLGYLLVSAVGAGCFIVQLGFPDFTRRLALDPYSVNSYSYWCSNIFYYASLMTTAYIAVVRCCCVAIPFRFKNVFTARRTVSACAAIFTASCCLHVPLLVTQYVVSYRDARTNATKFTVVPAANRNAVVAFNDIVNRNVISWLTMAIIFVSFTLLTAKLRSASRFRQAASGQIRTAAVKDSAPRGHVFPSDALSGYLVSQDQVGGSQSFSTPRALHGIISRKAFNDLNESSPRPTVDGREAGTRKLKASRYQRESTKDIQIIKSVALISALFLVLALPFMVYSLVRRLIPAFSAGEMYSNLFSLITSTSAICAYINSSVNIFIFYCCNTKFRNTTLYFF
ncbi:unnamed protein product, partial [Lymnaea stagnalis]